MLFHEPGRRQLQDVVTCVRHTITIDQAGFLRERACRPLSEAAGRDAQAVCALSGCLGRRARHCKALSLRHERADLPISEEAIVPGMTAQQSLEKFYLGRRQ